VGFQNDGRREPREGILPEPGLGLAAAADHEKVGEREFCGTKGVRMGYR
jgi:hypothetical protein